MEQKKIGTFIATCRKEHKMTQMQFAGERILPDDIPKKAEENVKNMALEYQSKDKKIVLCMCCSVLLTLVAISINLSVGGMWFEGTPVFSNLLVLVLLMISWSLFLCWIREDLFMQKIVAIISTIFLLLSIAEFILTFWDIRGNIVHIIGFPCEVIFYGLKLIFDWIHIYLIVAILAFIGLVYSKKNIDKANSK